MLRSAWLEELDKTVRVVVHNVLFRSSRNRIMVLWDRQTIQRFIVCLYGSEYLLLIETLVYRSPCKRSALTMVKSWEVLDLSFEVWSRSEVAAPVLEPIAIVWLDIVVEHWPLHVLSLNRVHVNRRSRILESYVSLLIFITQLYHFVNLGERIVAVHKRKVISNNH